MQYFFGICFSKPAHRKPTFFTLRARKKHDYGGAAAYIGESMYEKTEGIVLRETGYKDSDKLLTVLTRDFGKITVKARGVKSNRSRSKAATQILTFSELNLYEQQGRYTLRESVVREMFPELRENIELLSLASYFVQLTETVAQENDPMPELLSLLLNALYALSKLKKPQSMVKAVFELRLACIAGFMPDLQACAVCGREQAEHFNISQGVLQCVSCRSEGLDGIRLPISSATRQALRYITTSDAKRLFSFSMSEENMLQLSQVTEGYLMLRLERGFHTLDFYKSLFI